jgi:ATP-binding cassette, subfamily B, bacterial PglK
MQYLSKILYILDKDRKKLPIIVILFIGVSLLDLIGLGLIGPYIALVMSPGELSGWAADVIGFISFGFKEDELFVYIGIAIVIVFVIKVSAIILVNFIITDFSYSLQLSLRSFLMRSYQMMPYQSYLARNSAEYIHNIQNITSQFSQNIVLVGLRVIGDMIVACAIFVMLAMVNLEALLMLLILLASLIISYNLFFRKKLADYGFRSNKASMALVQGIHEGVEGLKEIRILGKSEYFYEKAKEGARNSGIYQRRLQLISLAPRYLIELLLVSFVVTLISFFLMSGFDIASMIAILSVFGVASMRLMPIASGISNSMSQLQFAKDSISRLYNDIYQLKTNKLDMQKYDYAYPRLSFESLEVKDIVFSYKNSSQPIVKNVSLSIKKSEIIGFIGTSGSGKTTLVDLLLGLLEPNSGDIFINHQPIGEDLQGWRNNIAYLPQQVFLIDDTLKKNIALGCNDDEIDNDKVMLAIKNAQLLDLVKDLTSGIETMIGERGVRLSGGQRQRVALARSFYHERDVLIMDESTSALDDTTEQEVIKEINQLKGKKTMIIVAHRLTTLKSCDRIYKMDKGEIVAFGTPKEMLPQHNL